MRSIKKHRSDSRTAAVARRAPSTSDGVTTLLTALFVFFAACWALVLATSAVHADDGTDAADMDGRFRLGYRVVDTSGSETKYREDIDLDEGVRLFELRLDYEAPSAQRQLVDRISLDMNGFGGDPFSGLSLRAQRFGAFDFRYDRTESTYFYEDILLPLELSSPALSNAGDFHHFDFDRVRDSAQLNVKLGPAAQLNVGFERFTKRGEGTTVYDISRDEFELDQPIDESYDQISVGFEYTWPKLTLVLEERHTEYDNVVEAFLPGASPGENTGNATELDFYFYDRPYSYDSDEHIVRVTSRPTDALLLTASGIFQSLDLEGEGAELGEGIAFDGQPLSVNTTGDVAIERDGAFFDLDFTYLFSERCALIGGVRQYEFEQEGHGQLGGSESDGLWEVETTSWQLGVEAYLRPDLTLALGLLAESRDVDHAAGEDGPGELAEAETDHDGYFARLGWKPSKRFRLDLSAEDASYDDPFTLASPTDRERWRLRARYTSDQGFYADATFQAHRFENGHSDWRSDRDQTSLRLGYRQGGLDSTVGYHRVEADQQIDQTVTTLPGFLGGIQFLYPVLYRSDADFVDARVRWRRDERLSLGGELRFYDNSGSFGVEREDLRAFVEIMPIPGYLLHLAYRTVDFDEADFDWDDYDAEILEISVGWQF